MPPGRCIAPDSATSMASMEYPRFVRPISVSKVGSIEASNKVRLLCVGRDLRGGGAERVQLTLLEHLDRTRFDIRLFYLSGRGALHGLIPSDIEPVYGVPGTENLKRRGPSLLANLTKLAHDSDVVFAMQGGTPIYLAAIAGRLARRPVVGWVHIDWSKQLRNSRPWHSWASRLHALPDRLIGVSEGVASGLIDSAPRLRNKVVALRNPLPVQRLRAQARVDLPAWAEEIFKKRTLLAAGRLTAQKGFDVLLSAFAEVIAGGSDLHLLVLGEGEDRKSLQQAAQDLGVDGRVFMPGFQDNPYPFFARAEAFVLSSHYEGLPTVILEAMALGLPVIATDCPHGPRELTQDGRCGMLVPPDNPAALAEAVRALTGSAARRADLRASGIARAGTYDAREVSPLFEELLLEHARGRR